MESDLASSKNNFALISKKFLFFSFIVYSIYCALNIGIHWDIFTHLESGNNKLKYFFSLGKINKEFNPDPRYGFYIITPGLSFAITAFVTNIFPQKYQVEVLHLSNLTISLVGVYGFGRFIRLIFNNSVSTISLIILVTYSVFFGHMSANPKDTVIATAYIWSIYLIFKYLNKQQGFSQKKIVLYLGFFLALGSGIRLLFIATLSPILIFLFLEVLFFKKLIHKSFSFRVFLLDAGKVFIIFYLILLIFWTHAHSNIFLKPLEILLGAFNPMHAIGANFGILNGNIYAVTFPADLKSYALINLFFKTPEYIIVLYIFSFFIFIKYNYFLSLRFKDFNYKLILIFVILVGTNLLFYFSPYPFYDGMRLFLFFIPIVLIIPSLVIFFIFSNLNLLTSRLMLGILIPLIVLYFFNFFSLTPFNYVYLNNFVKKPEIKFENDYLGLTLNELLKKSDFLNRPNTKINICGVGVGQIKYYLKKYNYSKTRIVRGDENPDYIIMNNRVKWAKDNNKLMTCMDFYKGKIISEVRRNKVLLSAIKEN